jgi:hypothetical protein
MIVDHDKNFGFGDLHVADKSRLFVSPARDDAVRSSSIRLYDFNAESVVGLFCGISGDISVGKQYCVDSHGYLFSMNNCTGVIFDIRSFRPGIVLHTNDDQIIGVPTSSTPVAFTYGSNEEINCWDIRMPGSHVYSMSTGNSKVDSIMWHESTSSLIGTTRYEYDNGSGIMDRPSRAYHDEHYYGYSWDIVLKKPCILQYMFQNGTNMNMEIEANLAKRPKIF